MSESEARTVAPFPEERRQAIAAVLDRPLPDPPDPPADPLPPEERQFLREEAEDLYWNELEWERLTGEEVLDDGILTELVFPGFLAFVDGLLLTESPEELEMPPTQHPGVVEDILEFLGERVRELEGGGDGDEAERTEAELLATRRLVDLVLYRLHGLESGDIEALEASEETHRSEPGGSAP